MLLKIYFQKHVDMNIYVYQKICIFILLKMVYKMFGHLNILIKLKEAFRKLEELTKLELNDDDLFENTNFSKLI